MSPQYLYPATNNQNKHENWSPSKYFSPLGNTQTIYLQLCLSSDVYFIALIKRTQDLHCTHIHMDSIS